MDQRQGDEILKAFGEKIKKLRAEKGLSTRDLSDRADINLGNLSDLELGKTNPGLLTVYALAVGLGVDPKNLLP